MKKQFITVEASGDYGTHFENIAIDQITRIIDGGNGGSIICLTDGDSVITPYYLVDIMSEIEMIQNDEDEEEENDD